MTTLHLYDAAAHRASSRLISIVAKYFHSSPGEILGLRRHKHITTARHACYYLMRTVEEMTYVRIGEEMGFKDHTTILSGVRSIIDRMKRDHEFAEQLRILEKDIRAESKLSDASNLCVVSGAGEKQS